MDNFICQLCNFSTLVKSKYTRHLSTQKHKENKKLHSKYQCVECSFYTDKITNYKRHTNSEYHKISCDSQNDKQLVIYDDSSNGTRQMTNVNGDYKDKIIDLQQQLLDEKNETNKILITQLQVNNETTKLLASQLKTKDKQIKTSNGLLKYLIQNYPDAPPLQQITNFTFVKDVTECRSRLPELLIEYYNTDKFVPYLAENIVNIYKKVDPKDQSLWTSDVSRENFIVKNKINEKESKWIRDNKGSMIVENAVRPCLNIILEELRWYYTELFNGVSFKGKLHPSIVAMDTILQIKQAIDDKKIEEEIRKRLSTKFCFPINTIEDTKPSSIITASPLSQVLTIQ